MMFKPGDRVVRTGPTASGVKTGTEWTVGSVDASGRLSLEPASRHYGIGVCWNPKYFTLAPSAPSPVDPEAWDPYIVMMVEGIDSSDGGAWGAEVVLALLCFLRHFRVAYGTRPRVELPEPWQPMETCPERGTVLLANTHGQVFIWSVRAILPQHHVIAWTPAPPHPYKDGEA